MKKLTTFCTLSLVLYIGTSFAYMDIGNSPALYLAEQGIIKQQNHLSEYRLDDKILRQEVIGMALQIAGIALPENYNCKKYFTDATKNDWVCRAVEIAADSGIITKGNKKANPSKYITKSEALSIIMRVRHRGVRYAESDGLKREILPFLDKNVELWQRDVMVYANDKNIIQVADYDSGTGKYIHQKYFYPNNLATRAEVFDYAKNMIENTEILPYLIARIQKESYVKNYNGFDYAFGSHQSKELSCFVNFLESPAIGGGFGFEDFIDRELHDGHSSPIVLRKTGGRPSIAVVEDSNNALKSETVPLDNGDTLEIFGAPNNACTSYLDLSRALNPYPLIIFQIYYYNILSKDNSYAYSMRSPAGVSLETFESWYKDIESIELREYTFKELGDYTYEFLVDMTEKGVKTTYKVKSKVNPDDFTIDNISSVKQ